MMKYTERYWQDVERVAKRIPGVRALYGKRVFITGGTGMICSAVAEILFHLNQKEDARIEIVLAGRSRERTQARFYCFEEGKDYTFQAYDATRESKLDLRADYIIHGASNANPAVYVKQPVETMLANIIGLNDLLAMAVRHQSRRLLYVSSSEVYGNKAENRPYKEEDYGFVDILNPRASYPSAKRAAETLCVAYGEEFGLDAVIARPGHIYGPTITDSDNRASAQFTRNAVDGEDIVMKSAGAQLRSYCYTLDCASAILTILLKGQRGQAYNISNRDSVVTISEIAQALAQAAGKQVVFEQASDAEKKGYNMMSNSSLDAQRLEELGWKAEFDLSEGTGRTVEILKNS